MKRKPIRPYLQAIHRRVHAMHLKSYEVYQPVLGPNGYSGGARDSKTRWQAIEPVLVATKAGSLVDLGCSEGYYVTRAAKAGLPFCVGVDFDQRRMFTCTNQVVLADLPHAGFMMGSVEPSLIDALPRFDAVVFLSVLHHLMYQQGVDYCTAIMKALATKTGKVCFFEMGQSDEHKESWANDVPDMGSDPHAWIQDFVTSSGFAKAEKISETSSFAGETQRALFACYP